MACGARSERLIVSGKGGIFGHFVGTSPLWDLELCFFRGASFFFVLCSLSKRIFIFIYCLWPLCRLCRPSLTRFAFFLHSRRHRVVMCPVCSIVAEVVVNSISLESVQYVTKCASSWQLPLFLYGHLHAEHLVLEDNFVCSQFPSGD